MVPLSVLGGDVRGSFILRVSSLYTSSRTKAANNTIGFRRSAIATPSVLHSNCT